MLRRGSCATGPGERLLCIVLCSDLAVRSLARGFSCKLRVQALQNTKAAIK